MKNRLVKRALLLSCITVGYNFLEGAISILAGHNVDSIALIGFGLDSFVESLSGGVIIWRFSHPDSITKVEEEKIERRAVKLIGYTFLILGLYVLYESIETLYLGLSPGPSLFGIIIAVVSLITMPILFFLKYKTGKEMGSASMITDSKQTLACMMLSFALLAGLGFNYLYGLWQADPIIGLVIVIFLFREGYGALREEKLCNC